MALEIHNFILTGRRLVQVETQSHHINGVLDEIQSVRKSSNLSWDAIYSAFYECEEDETITFYESEFIEENQPGIWTYVSYDCEEGQEEIVSNSDIDVLVALYKIQEEIEQRKNGSKSVL